ncbi:hypothetical protein D3C79_1036310 [compost metagenome]
MRHAIGLARVPLRAVDRAPRKGLHGDGRDELLGRFGHYDLHGRAGLDQQPAQLRRLVTSYASAEAQNQMFTSELFHAPNLAESGRWTAV